MADAQTAPAAEPPVEEDEYEVLLTSIDLHECDRAVRLLASAILGLRADIEEWDSSVLVPRVHQIPEEIETRLRIAGIVNPDAAPETNDSRVAAYFVHTANRVVRLARHNVMQLEFFGHCLIAMTALYASRTTAINQLYADAVYDAAAAVTEFLRRIRISATDAAGTSAALSSGSSGVRKRFTASPPTFDASSLNADNIATSPFVEGMRKTAIAFLHLAGPTLPRYEDDMLRDPAAQLTRADLERITIIPRLSELMAQPVAREYVEAIDATWSGRYAVSSSVVPLLVAPAFIIASVAAALLVWSPVIYPPTLVIFPALRPLLALTPQWEWVRYAASAVSAFSIIALVFYMANFSPGRFMPKPSAAVHAFLAGDGDVTALFALDAGQHSVAVALLAGGKAAAGDAPATTAATTAATPADGAAGAAAAATASADGAAGAAAGADAAGAGAEAGPRTLADWADAMDVPEEDADALFNALDYADHVEDVAMQLQAEQQQAAADATAATTSPIAAAAAGTVAAPAAGGDGRRVVVPDGLLPTLQILYHKLTELGELEHAATVNERIAFLDDAIAAGLIATQPEGQQLVDVGEAAGAAAAGSAADAVDARPPVDTAAAPAAASAVGGVVASGTGEPETPSSVVGGAHGDSR